MRRLARLEPTSVAGWRAAFVPVATGVAIGLGQPPLGLIWLALPALCLGVGLGMFAPTARAAGKRGFLIGLGFGLVTFFWITQPFMVDAARDGWMAPFALFFMAAGVALFWWLAFWTAQRSLGRASLGAAMALPVYLTAAEMLRSYAFTGFPWGLTAYVWVDTPVYQLASFTGPHGLTFLTFFGCSMTVWFGRRGWSWRILAPAAMALFAYVAGSWLENLPVPGESLPDRPWVRIIQPNAPQDQKWDPAMMPVFYNRQLRLTGDSAAKPLELVVWPEVAVPFLLNDPDAPLWEISGAAGGVPVVVGGMRLKQGRAFNSLAVLLDGGEISGVYDKYHLVPFGEYIPGQSLIEGLGLRAMTAKIGNGFSAGEGPKILDLGDLGRALPLICYEAIFPHEIRQAEARPDWMLMLTNDAWFGEASGPYQHFAQARARAIEMGLPMLRAANTGISAIIDARGRVTAALPLGVAGKLDGALPPALPPTLYWTYGDIPTFLLLIVFAVWLVLRRGSNSIDRDRSEL